MNAPPELAVRAVDVAHRYGSSLACDGVSFDVEAGTHHCFLGPNGSGKSTLFKVLATAYPLQRGDVSIFGLDLRREERRIRPLLGVVFQSPALDGMLTVRENLVHGGHMYGLRGPELDRRVDEMLGYIGLADRARDRVKELSGGLKRRTELAKGLLPKPRLLLLDEPSSGLDPGARRDLWRFLRSLDGVTVLFTTHLMDEAELADRVAILSGGKLVAAGRPHDLVREVGEQILEVSCADAVGLCPRIAAHLQGLAGAPPGAPPAVLGRSLRIERDDAHQLVAPLMQAFGADIDRITLSHPSLEDVYIRYTGHRFWGEES
jgi:ABC-2 type transport system ATP-binding protein